VDNFQRGRGVSEKYDQRNAKVLGEKITFEGGELGERGEDKPFFLRTTKGKNMGKKKKN